MTKNGNITEFRSKEMMLGWISKLMKRRSTFSIAIHKIVCDGVALHRGQELFCYFSEENNRPILKVYLDGSDKNGGLPLRRNINTSSAREGQVNR